MVEQIAAVQALVVGLLLGWAGVWKVTSPQARALATRSALGKILRDPRQAQAAHLATGVGEIIVAALLLLPPERAWAMRVATVFALGFVGYLALAWRIAPDRPCACLGGRISNISRRSVLRAVVLLALTLLGWGAHEYWAGAIIAAPWVLLVFAAEALGLWVLSPEFGWAGAQMEKRLLRAARLRLDPTCARVALDWDELERRLRRTPHYLELALHLSALRDHWREECWAFFAYGASIEGRAATAVFAVPTLFDKHEVSVAVVDDADNSTLLSLASARGVTPPVA